MVSVILPVRNEASFISATVASILNQDYRGPIEVVIADGMSTDGTREILETLTTADDRIRCVNNPTGRTPNGLNAAIRASRGDVIVRCDGHAELPTDYVSIAVETLRDTGAANVGGVQDAVGVDWGQRAIALAMSSRIGVGNAQFHYGGEAGPTDTVFLGSFRRDALEEAGLFDENLTRNQDYELNIRLRAGGGVVWFDPRLRVVYRPRKSLGALARQYYQYGTWKRRVIRMHPKSARVRQLLPPLFVLALAASAVAVFTPWWWLGMVIPIIYATVLTLAAARTLVRTRDTAALGFPIAVATMHIAWGLGFLIGTKR